LAGEASDISIDRDKIKFSDNFNGKIKIIKLIETFSKVLKKKC
jgi:hypothetical protein